jgi:hypothetical protein
MAKPDPKRLRIARGSFLGIPFTLNNTTLNPVNIYMF